MNKEKEDKMNTKKENLQENKYPLSEETFLKLRNLTPQEYNKLPIELLMKYAKMVGMKRKERGLLDWE